MHESLLRFDFERSNVAIAADGHWIDIPSPIQFGPDYQRFCSRWVTNAYRPLEVIFVNLRHFSGGVTECQANAARGAQGYHQLLAQINQERANISAA
jgi:hypothetical protein